MPQVRGNVALAPMMMTDAYLEPALRPQQEVVVPMSRRVQIMELREAMCKWPIGDPADATFGFCGRGSDGSSPYCAEHARVAFQPAKKRERRAREFDYIQRLAG